jgi:hypothetical protein
MKKAFFTKSKKNITLKKIKGDKSQKRVFIQPLQPQKGS